MSVTKTAIQTTFAGFGDRLHDLEAIGTCSGRLHPVTAWLAGLGASSRASMASALRRAMSAISPDANAMRFDWRTFSLEHMLAARVGLECRGSPASRNMSLVALRGVARACWQLGLIDRDELEKIRSVRSFRHVGETQTGRWVSRADRTRLFRMCDGNPQVRARDRALLALLLGGGLRRAEASALRRRDIDLAECMLTVRGKGGRTRKVPMSAAVARAVAAWVSHLPTDYRHVFPLLSRSGKFLRDRHVSGSGVAALLRRRTAAAGIAPFRPHDLRRTCASDCLEAGIDVLSVQRLLGHSSPTTTLRYDVRDQGARRAAVEAVFVPQ